MIAVVYFILVVLYALACIADGPDIKPTLKVKIGTYLHKQADNFTKKSNPELYQDVIKGYWYDCYDVRDPNHYGSFDCLNCPDFEPYVADGYWEERERRNKARVIEVIKKLPVDTLFHFADSH